MAGQPYVKPGVAAGAVGSSHGPPLARRFFARDAATVARALLGCEIAVAGGGDGARLVRRARIVETEAYMGPHDLACHAAKGRTERTEVMFGPAGHAYVYLVYGMHELFNVVTGPPSFPAAVLVRAVEPLAGVAGRTDGPGRLTKALGISRADNGADLCGARGRLVLLPGPPPARPAAGPRVGVPYAGAWSSAPLRFLDPDSVHVSRASAGRRAQVRGGSQGADLTGV